MTEVSSDDIIFYADESAKIRIKPIREDNLMKRIKTLTTKNLKDTVKKGGCGECQTSCQSACKTSCTVGNQTCENAKRGSKIKIETR